MGSARTDEVRKRELEQELLRLEASWETRFNALISGLSVSGFEVCVAKQKSNRLKAKNAFLDASFEQAGFMDDFELWCDFRPRGPFRRLNDPRTPVGIDLVALENWVDPPAAGAARKRARKNPVATDDMADAIARINRLMPLVEKRFAEFLAQNAGGASAAKALAAEIDAARLRARGDS